MKQFGNVEMFNSVQDPNAVNFEGIFNMSAPRGGDPLPGSIFNIQTLQRLLNVTEGLPDIVAHPESQTKTMDLSILSELTETLGFKSNEQTYLFYMWLVYCKKYTFAREDESPDKAYSIASQVGQ